jgi:hypothetical protein
LGITEELAGFGFAVHLAVMMNILVHWVETGEQPAPDELATALGRMLKQMVSFDLFR